MKLVIRTTLLEAGHHGGKLFTAEELGKCPQSYDGRYVTLDAGDCEDGTGFHRKSIGQIYNTTFDGKALRTELHLDRDKLTPAMLTALEKGVFRAIPSVFHEFDGNEAKNIVPNHVLLSFPQLKGECLMSNCSKFTVNPKQVEPLIIPSLEEAFKRNTDADTFKEIDSRKEDNKPISRQIEDGLNVVDLQEVFKAKYEEEKRQGKPAPKANDKEPEGLEVPDLAAALRNKLEG